MNKFILASQKLLVTCIFLGMSVFSAVTSASDKIDVENGYVRESIPGNTITSAYMTISNNSANSVKLIGVSSKSIPRIEIHEHTMNNGMMQMRQKAFIEITAGEQVVLQPMGLHLMMFDLAQPLKDGELVEIELEFSEHSALAVTLPVHSIKKKKPQHHHH